MAKWDPLAHFERGQFIFKSDCRFFAFGRWLFAKRELCKMMISSETGQMNDGAFVDGLLFFPASLNLSLSLSLSLSLWLLKPNWGQSRDFHVSNPLSSMPSSLRSSSTIGSTIRTTNLIKYLKSHHFAIVVCPSSRKIDFEILKSICKQNGIIVLRDLSLH